MYCKGLLKNLQSSGPILLIRLEYNIPHIDLNKILVSIGPLQQSDLAFNSHVPFDIRIKLCAIRATGFRDLDRTWVQIGQAFDCQNPDPKENQPEPLQRFKP